MDDLDNFTPGDLKVATIAPWWPGYVASEAMRSKMQRWLEARQRGEPGLLTPPSVVRFIPHTAAQRAAWRKRRPGSEQERITAAHLHRPRRKKPSITPIPPILPTPKRPIPDPAKAAARLARALTRAFARP